MICVADSTSSRHLAQVWSSLNPSLKRCLLMWQGPVNSPTTHLNLSLFSLNTSFVLLAKSPGINPFACLNPIMASQCFYCDFCSSSPWPLSWQLQLSCRKLVQVMWTDVQILFLPVYLPFHYPWYPHDLAPISVEPCYVRPVVLRDWWQSQTSLEVIWCLPSASIAA
jgi:hypothetical protein